MVWLLDNLVHVCHLSEEQRDVAERMLDAARAATKTPNRGQTALDTHLKVVDRDANILTLPCLMSGDVMSCCGTSGEDFRVRCRFTSEASPPHQDGDGTKLIKGWLEVIYLEGSGTITFQRISDGKSIGLDIQAGLRITFCNTHLKHGVSPGQRVLLGPVPVATSADQIRKRRPHGRGGSPCCKRPCAEETCCGNMCKACRRDWYNPNAPYTVMNVSVQDKRIVATSLSGEEMCAIPYGTYGPPLGYSSLGYMFRELVTSLNGTDDALNNRRRGCWGDDEKMYMAVIGDEKFCESDWDDLPCTQEEFLPNPEAEHRSELIHSFTYHAQGTYKTDKIFLWERDGAKLLQFNSSKLHGRWSMYKHQDRPWSLTLYVHWNGEMNRKFKQFTSTDDGQTWEQDANSCCCPRYNRRCRMMSFPGMLRGPTQECKSWQCGWRSWLSRD